MYMLFVFYIIACTNTDKENTESSPKKEKSKEMSSETKEFDPCALQEVRACLMGNPYSSCDAHRGVFGVYRPSLVDHPLSKNPEKNCSESVKQKYIDKGFCPTENVLYSYVVWDVLKKTNTYTQFGYQVIYKNEKSADYTMALKAYEKYFTTIAQYPNKKVVQCSSKGKVIKEL